MPEHVPWGVPTCGAEGDGLWTRFSIAAVWILSFFGTLGAMRTLIAFLVCLLACGFAGAQSRTVYKCAQGGKVAYSDEPCLNATVVDATPTRGLDKSTGVSRKGFDVQREERREAVAEALRPITGMNARQFDTFGRRQKLSVDAQRECSRLDKALPAATSASNPDQTSLLLMRKRYKDFGC